MVVGPGVGLVVGPLKEGLVVNGTPRSVVVGVGLVVGPGVGAVV